MEKGKIYQLNPPVVIDGISFTIVSCEERITQCSREFRVRGVLPGTEDRQFVIKLDGSVNFQEVLKILPKKSNEELL